MVAKEAELKQMIEEVVERLEKKSFDVLQRERAECDELRRWRESGGCAK